MHHLQYFKELLEAIEASNVSTNVLLELVDLGQQPQRLQREVLATAPLILICFCVVGLLCMIIMACSFRTVIRQLSDLHLRESKWAGVEKPSGKTAPQDQGLELQTLLSGDPESAEAGPEAETKEEAIMTPQIVANKLAGMMSSFHKA